MSSYPSSYCVKCKSHTDTLGKHTVMLSNKRRALKGVCPVCATETYRLMPEKKEAKAKERPRQLSVVSSTSSSARSPEAGKPEIPIYTQTLDHISRVEHMRLTLGRRLISYGILSLIFGCSIAVGFVLCMAFLN
jgi:hypothetical protein